MRAAFRGVPDHVGENARLKRFGQDAQALGQEQPRQPPVLFVAQPAYLLNQRVGKSSNFAWHTLFLAELGLDQIDQGLHREISAIAVCADDNRIAHRCTEHHQPHD